MGSVSSGDEDKIAERKVSEDVGSDGGLLYIDFDADRV